MFGRIRWIMGLLFIAYSFGVLFVDLNFITGTIIFLVGTIIIPKTDKDKEKWKNVPWWVARILDAIAVGIFYIIWLNNQPLNPAVIDTAKITDPITAQTERIVTLFDVGSGYMLWMIVYMQTFSILSNIPAILAVLAFFVAELLISDVQEEILNREIFRLPLQFLIPLVAAVGTFVYLIWWFFPFYLNCVDIVNGFVFGMTWPEHAFRFSIPVTRLTKVLTSIGAAPSFAKLSAVILAIAGVWGTFEAVSNLFRFTGKLFSKASEKAKE